jgi:hypothetical protein
LDTSKVARFQAFSKACGPGSALVPEGPGNPTKSRRWQLGACLLSGFRASLCEAAEPGPRVNDEVNL